MMFPPQTVIVTIEFTGIQKTGLEDENSEKGIDTNNKESNIENIYS